jgi:hypothetical protein
MSPNGDNAMGKIKATERVQVVAWDAYQQRVQKVFEMVRGAIDARMAGQTVKVKRDQVTLKAPTGRILIIIDTPESARHQAGALGTYSRSWSIDGERTPTITVNPVHLQSTAPMAALVELLAHEYVHAYADANAIQDTSRGGWYHSKVFKALCDASGILLATETEKYGYAATALLPSGFSLVEDIEAALPLPFDAVKHLAPKPERKAKPGPITYECPDCGATVKGKAGSAFILYCEGAGDDTHAPARMESNAPESED